MLSLVYYITELMVSYLPIVLSYLGKFLLLLLWCLFEAIKTPDETTWVSRGLSYGSLQELWQTLVNGL